VSFWYWLWGDWFWVGVGWMLPAIAVGIFVGEIIARRHVEGRPRSSRRDAE
jgi:hypothetical protein